MQSRLASNSLCSEDYLTLPPYSPPTFISRVWEYGRAHQQMASTDELVNCALDNCHLHCRVLTFGVAIIPTMSNYWVEGKGPK